MAVTKKLDKETAKINRVNDAVSNTFNIVSHQGPPRKVETLIMEQKTKGVAPRGYNFVTNLSLDDHLKAPTLYDEAFVINRAGKPKEKRSAVGNNREFSIVNNNFYEDHDTKKKKEYERFKSHTLEKYWATHDYDPIRGKFFDAEKEERYREQRNILSKVHGTAQTLRLAPSVQYSEGSCYDIVNHAIHDDGKVTVSNTVADRSLHRMKRVGKEIEAREVGIVKAEKDDEKRLARISYKRWENTIDRGYDFLKNTPIPADVPQPLPSRPTSMWARLQTVENGGATTGTRATTSSVPNTGRIRNLSGAGPQYANSRIHLETRDTFPDSPGTYASNQEYGGDSPQQPQRLTPLPAAASRAVTSIPASRAALASSGGAGPNYTSYQSSPGIVTKTSARGVAYESARPKPVPSLDLTRAEAPEKVSYVEPAHGSKGLAIPMVRTGGMSGF